MRNAYRRMFFAFSVHSTKQHTMATNANQMSLWSLTNAFRFSDATSTSRCKTIRFEIHFLFNRKCKIFLTLIYKNAINCSLNYQQISDCTNVYDSWLMRSNAFDDYFTNEASLCFDIPLCTRLRWCFWRMMRCDVRTRLV